MKKVIITGPTGVLGVALVRLLLSSNVEVTAICRKGSKRVNNLPVSPLLQVVECDLQDLHILSDSLAKDYDVFFHLGWSGTSGNLRNDAYVQNENVTNTIRAVELAKELGCKKFIGAGSQAEYGRCDRALTPKTLTYPENAYGVAKLCAGYLSRIRCEQLGLAHVWVRVLSVYGPCDGENTLVMSTINKLMRGEVPSCTMAEQIWDYIYCEDAARAFACLGESSITEKVYCLGSGEGKPLVEYLQEIKKIVNSNVRLGLGEIPYADKQVMHLCADISELKRDIGFEPSVSFEEGIRRTITWIRNEKQK